MRALCEWGRLPSEFNICDPEDDLDLMMAFMSARDKMESWDTQERERLANLSANAK